MSKSEVYYCTECNYETTGYFGKCPSCASWGTLEEKRSNLKSTNPSSRENTKNSSSKLLDEIDTSNDIRINTKIGELNRVMGGGIVDDSVNILTAVPGAGKSTLLLQLASDLSNSDMIVLYVSGEESASQIKNRAVRLGLKSNNLYILSTNSINIAEDEVQRLNPDILIFDSIQTLIDETLTQRSGSPTQINSVSNKIVEMSKYSSKKRTSFIVGQMTKQDELAGVRTLEHLVDSVMILETGDTDHMRILYSTKNRYGNTGEVGFFEMTDKGLVSIDNPSEYFVSNNESGSGRSLTVLMNGSRYIISEIECLVSQSYFPYPQRISESMNKDPFNIIASIVEESSSINLDNKNIIMKTTGGLKIKDVSADLAIGMAIASSYYKKTISSDVLFLGELGLTGEVKRVQNLDGRIREAARLGYKKVVISKYQECKKTDNIKVIKVSNISDAVQRFIN